MIPYVLMIIIYIAIPAIGGLIAVGIHYYKIVQYKKTAYYKITHNEYEYTMSDVGRRGEYILFREMSRLENDGAQFLFNLYIPRENGHTTEIDMLMIYRGEVFVFENKNYGGWIFGKASDVYWTQSLKKGRRAQKEKFYNPIMQNATHIKYLRHLVGDGVKINSVIVFSDRAVLKRIECGNNSAVITQTHNVLNYVKTKQYSDEINNTEKIYQILYQYTQVSEEVKREHINHLREGKSTSLNFNGISNSAPWSVGGIYAAAGLFSQDNMVDLKESKVEVDTKKEKVNIYNVVAIICEVVLAVCISVVLIIYVTSKN